MTARIKVKWLSIQRKTIDPLDMPDGDLELWSIPDFDNGSPSITNRQSIGSSKKVVFPGDVLLSKIVPHIRRAWIVRESNLPQYASTEWLTFHSSKVRPDFLRYALLTDEFNRQMQLNSNGMGSLKRADPEKVGEQQINLPTIKKQKIIADFLDKRLVAIDAVLHQKSEQLKKLSSYRQSLITRAVTKGLDGDHQTSFIPLKYWAKLNPDVEQAMSDEIEYLPMEKVKNGMFLHHSDKLANLPPSLNSFEDGDILLAKVTPCFENGNICLAENCKGGVGRCSTELFVLRPNPQKVMPKFLMLLLQTQSFKQEAACQMRGTGGLKRIPADWLCNYKFPIPSLEKQKQIVEYMASKHSNLDGLTKKIKDSICLLNDYRSSLISAAVTGQLAIEEAEE